VNDVGECVEDLVVVEDEASWRERVVEPLEHRHEGAGGAVSLSAVTAPTSRMR
jgi:hypothetical protein